MLEIMTTVSFKRIKMAFFLSFILRGVLIFLCLTFYHSLFAQNKKTFVVNPGEKVYDVISPVDRYTYPAFLNGRVYFRNGSIGASILNYNKLLASLEFITAKGDSLLLDQLEEIRYVVISKDTFFTDKICLKQIDHKGEVRLAEMRVIQLTNVKHQGAMGLPTDAAVDAFTTISSRATTLLELVPSEILTFKEQVVYYLGDSFGQFKQANKKNLIALFGKNKNQVTDYLEKNKVDFLKEADMLKLLDFLASL
jgi:hypothetical protein